MLAYIIEKTILCIILYIQTFINFCCFSLTLQLTYRQAQNLIQMRHHVLLSILFIYKVF